MINKFEVVNKKTGEKKQYATLTDIAKQLNLSYAVCSRIARKAYKKKLQQSTKELLDSIEINPISHNFNI